VECLRRHIAASVHSGAISDSDMDILKIRAQQLGVSPSTLDDMVREATGGEMQYGGFRPRWYHVVMAVMFIVILSMFVFMNINFDSDGGNVEKVSPSSLRNMPVTSADLVHIYSGNCDGMSVLITVKSVQDVSEGKAEMVYDIKCDFVPVASGAKCEVDLGANTLDFGHHEAIDRKIMLGKGTVERTPAGKIRIKAGNGKYELVQL